MATQGGTFTVVSVAKAIWLQTVLFVNVSKLMHMSTVKQHQMSKTWTIFKIGSGAQIASRIMI
jgi:serine acetyltransferase